MQVIPCGPPGVPYVANDLPGLHLLACGDADGLAVGVEGLQAAAVVELDVVAIAAAPTVHAVGDYDGTIGGGQDGRACGGSNVGAAVVADLAGDGIGAVAERRGNAARNRQRPLQRAGALPGTGRGQNLPTRFQHLVAGTYKKWAMENGVNYFSVASGGGTGRTLHPDNMAAGPASYGLTDSMGRMHGDAQFAGSSSVPAHVEMMGLIGMGNNPMVGATVACAVAVEEAGK